jgi:hypothetical protein
MPIRRAPCSLRAALVLIACGLLSPCADANGVDTIAFTGLEAAFSLADDPASDDRILSLLVDSALFGRGGFARGEVSLGGATPGDTRWLTDPFSGATPDDNSPALSFLINSADEVSGVEPTPFRLFVAGGAGGLLGELDFSAARGMLGSLSLSGVLVHAVDAGGKRTGTTYNVDPFTIQAVPLPAAAWLFASALLGLARVVRRKPSRPDPGFAPASIPG